MFVQIKEKSERMKKAGLVLKAVDAIDRFKSMEENPVIRDYQLRDVVSICGSAFYRALGHDGATEVGYPVEERTVTIPVAEEILPRLEPDYFPVDTLLQSQHY